MFFDVMQNNSFYKVKLSSELMTKYEDIVKISNNVYINGYLNTYIKGKQNIYYIYPKEIKLLDQDYKLDDDKPTITYDTDGIMLWHGKRCESIPPTKEELEEIENLLNEFQ